MPLFRRDRPEDVNARVNAYVDQVRDHVLAGRPDEAVASLLAACARTSAVTS